MENTLCEICIDHVSQWVNISIYTFHGYNSALEFFSEDIICTTSVQDMPVIPVLCLIFNKINLVNIIIGFYTYIKVVGDCSAL